MNYVELNYINRQKMQSTCNNTARFEWEDSGFLNLLLGELPKLNNYFSNTKIRELYNKLAIKYREYDFYKTDTVKFVEDLKLLVDDIKKIEPYWSGLNISHVEEIIKMHKFCLVSGTGGIGKSYFVKCLEEELSSKNVKHLCLYGKYNKDICTIDFDEIIEIGCNETFVFVFDAINEIDEQSQIDLLGKINHIKSVHGVRIIITYRSYTIDESILSRYKELSEYQHEFSGISFESAVEWLQKTPVVDIAEYLDVLYSNNPLLLSKLPYILSNDDTNKDSKNNVSRFTYIYEQYIKRSLDKETWNKTKIVAKYMYDNNIKNVKTQDIFNYIASPVEYISTMEQMNFLNRYTYNNEEHFNFVIESLADYLIVRHMWSEIHNQATDKCVEIIKEKINLLYGINESVILMLFDKFSPNYILIKEILNKTGLIKDFRYETLVKIHFSNDDINDFLKTFIPKNTEELITYFAGYVNKPFNCTNYLNDYYVDDEHKQCIELSNQLCKKRNLFNLKIRLKNILYFTSKCSCKDDRAFENLYLSLWCSSAGNQDIRNLSIKLLYEIVLRNPELVQNLIDIFPRIKDYYIRDAIIYVLSSCQQSKSVHLFFQNLLNDHNFILAKSIRRMSIYENKPYQYIDLIKNDLLCREENVVSEDFSRFLHSIDLYEKNLMPFRFWGIEGFEPIVHFLKCDKNEIKTFNTKLEFQFSCVKHGDCCGRMNFQESVAKLYDVAYSQNKISGNELLCSLEKVFRDVFNLYGLPFNYEEYIKRHNTDFQSSLFRKCTCISFDILYGSLMCNYYCEEFGTYNNYQNSIGYEVYDPIEFGEELNIRSPLPIFQSQIEKMGDLSLLNMDFSGDKDETWWRDLEVTKKNVLNMLKPIMFENTEWIMISGRICIKDSESDYAWKDEYDLYCCTSDEETLNFDGKERYLTIELDDYKGNILEYHKCDNKPWLCKLVPSIYHNEGLFEDAQLVLPPSNIVNILHLDFCLEKMCWYNDVHEKIMICNNNRASYFEDQIMSNVYIRKDAYDELKKLTTVKFFAFAEKFLKEYGYCDDTDFHFEISDEKIVKAVPNRQTERKVFMGEVLEQCKKCPYGFYCDNDSTVIIDDLISEYDGLLD